MKRDELVMISDFDHNDGSFYLKPCLYSELKIGDDFVFDINKTPLDDKPYRLMRRSGIKDKLLACSNDLEKLIDCL